MRKSYVDKTEVVTLIKVTSILGDGTKDNPVRPIYEYWTLNGRRVFIVDSILHSSDGYYDISYPKEN